MSVKRGLLQLALAALLLAAQHVREPLPAQSQQQDPAKNSAHAGLCKFHVSYAEVLGAVVVRLERRRVTARAGTAPASAGASGLPARDARGASTLAAPRSAGRRASSARSIASSSGGTSLHGSPSPPDGTRGSA